MSEKGLTSTILATQFVKAAYEDDPQYSGKFGPAVSAWLRSVAEELDRRSAEQWETMTALQESLQMQAHYAQLLNMHDAGCRMVFNDVPSWMARLRKIGMLPPVKP